MMRLLYPALVVLLATLACGSSTIVQAAEEPKIPKLVEVMTSPTLGWRERLKAEQALLAMEPTLANRLEILEALFPARERIGAAHGLYPGTGSLKSDAQIGMPPEAQISYSISRVWKRLLYGKPSRRIATLLRRLFLTAKTPYGKSILLRAMLADFPPKMEPALAKILRADEPQPNRNLAAEVLLTHLPQKYAPIILDRMEDKDLPLKERVRLFKVFTPPSVKRIGDDEKKRLVRIGFGLLAEQKKVTPDYPYYAFFIATALESYTGETFKPDREAKKYQPPTEQAEALIAADTVSNALAWWREHQRQYGVK